MKKKIALLLAVVMTIALLPTNVFASASTTVADVGSTNRGSDNDRTLFLETSSGTFKSELSVPLKNGTKKEDCAYVQNGPTLVVEFKNGILTGDQFGIVLNGGSAKWGLPLVSGAYGVDLNDDSNNFPITAIVSENPTVTVLAGLIDEDNGRYVNNAQVGTNLGGINTGGGGTYVRFGDDAFPYADIRDNLNDRGSVTSADSYFGGAGNVLDVVGSKKTMPNRYQLPYTMAFTSDNMAVITILGTAEDKVGGFDPVIVIPLIFRAEFQSTVTAQVKSEGFINGSRVTSTAPITVATGAATATKTEFGPALSNYELFPISEITISEIRARSMQENGVFVLTAPTGFEFINPSLRAGTTSNVGTPPTISGISDLNAWFAWFLNYSSYIWSGQSVVTVGRYQIPLAYNTNWWSDLYNTSDIAASNPWDLAGPYGSASLGSEVRGGFSGSPQIEEMWFDVNRNGTWDPTKVSVRYSGLGVSNTNPGTVKFTGIPLLLGAAENAPMGDVMVEIKNGKDSVSGVGEAGVSTEKVKAGTRSEWGISFTSGGSPTIYNGQYENGGEDDGWHKVGHVTFKENLPGSWLANRQTAFSVPEGVKIVKIEFKDAWDVAQMHGGGYQAYSLFDKSWSGGRTFYNNSGGVGGIEVGPTNPGGWNTQDKLLSDGKLAGYVSVSDQQVVLSGIVLPQTDRRIVSGFRMDMWVSVESGWEGDITLTASGAGLGAELVDPIVIGTAKNPVNINVVDGISDIKIGYQYQTTSDFEIVEAKAGILRRGDTVKLSLTDDIHVTDMSFVDADFLVTDGDIKLSNYRVSSYANTTAASPSLGTIGNSGTISFDISAASSKASTILFSNVQVKIDRTIPESNLRPYKIVAWGNAIANNYDSTSKPARATFKVPGIMADYLKVATLATGGGLSSKIEVPIGSTTMYVNGKATEMTPPAAPAFIDPATDSTMIPVAAVSQQLMGLTGGTVNWDDATRTVTIFTESRVIQFTIGSDQIIVNGVASTMTAADGSGRPVRAQIVDVGDGLGRSFIPFRALGNALGVAVGWDAETQTAIFNP